MEIRLLLKKTIVLFILCGVLVWGGVAQGAQVAQAQETPVELEWLTVDIWPDFDRSEVLVLLTGSLPPEAPLPVELVIPLPEGADLNAVARVDEEDNLLADLDPQVGADSVSFSLPERRFRVEYYYPYEDEGLSRSFAFEWLAPNLGVRDLSLAVQQPALAATMETDPEPEMVTQGNDQLDYYNLPDEAVPAGEPYRVEVMYTLSEDRLTITTAEEQPESAPASTAAAADGGLDLDWPVVLGIVGALLILAALGWQLFSTRLAGPRSAPRKPRPARAQKRASSRRPAAGKARFCHNCGERAQPDDRFCRECGTQLKR